MNTITVKKIDIDTIGSTTTWGRVTVEINGRTVTLTLDQEHIDGLCGIAGGYAAEIMAALYEKRAA